MRKDLIKLQFVLQDLQEDAFNEYDKELYDFCKQLLEEVAEFKKLHNVNDFT